MTDSNVPQAKDSSSSHLTHRSPTPNLTQDDAAGARLPHVVLLGGQDQRPLSNLVGCWKVRCSALLPSHRLSVAAWPTLDGRRPAERGEVLMLDTEARRATKKAARRMPRWLASFLATHITWLVGWLDARMRVSADGKPMNWPSRFTCQFIRYTVAVLYGKGPLGRQVLELSTQMLQGRPVDVVIGHSLGGTMALLAAFALHERGEDVPPFALITLGTSSGPAITRSPLLQRLPRTADGRIALPPGIRSWLHVWSPSDALVAAPCLPREFAGVELLRVDTGPFSFQNHAHALGAYLAVTEVIDAIHRHLAR